MKIPICDCGKGGKLLSKKSKWRWVGTHLDGQCIYCNFYVHIIYVRDEDELPDMWRKETVNITPQIISDKIMGKIIS